MLCLSDLSETWTFLTGFRQILKITFHENPFSRDQGVHCRRIDTETDGRTDVRQTHITRVIVALLNFSNVPKNAKIHLKMTSLHPRLYEMCPQHTQSATFVFLLPVDNIYKWSHTYTDFTQCHGVPLPSLDLHLSELIVHLCLSL